MKARLFVLSMGIFLFLTGCGHSNETALPAPETAPVQVTQNYPGVARVVSIGQLCSGVFTSPTALLTASHCVKTGSPVSVQMGNGRIDSSLVIKNGPGAVGDSKDLAVVIFSRPVVDIQAVYPIGQVSVGETVHLVGFGCSDASYRGGSGVKRAGTNSLYRISQYLEVLTPVQAPAPRAAPRGILGPINRAGSCFGDSGGPMLKQAARGYFVVGIDHAVIPEGGQQISAYTDLSRPENLNFIRQVNSQYQLGIQGSGL